MKRYPLVKFGDVVRLSTTRIPDPLAAGIERYVGLEHITPEDLHIHSWGLVADGTTFTNAFKPGQVLFGKRRAYQRKVAVAEFAGVCSGDIYVLESKDPDVLLPELLPFLCQTEGFYQHAVGTSAGSLSPRTNWTLLAGFEFPLPSLDDQRRIADLLWAQDDLLTEYARVKETLNILRVAYWNGIKCSDKYPLTPLREIAEISTGSTPSRGNDTFWKSGTIPWLPTQKVNEKIIGKADEYITEKALKECSMKIIPVGCVLVALYGEGKTRGSVAYLNIHSCINQAFAAVKPSSELNSWYLYHCLENSYSELRSFSQGSSQKNLNGQLVGQFKIPLPTLEEQTLFADFLNSVLNKTADVQFRFENCQKLKKEVLGRLI